MSTSPSKATTEATRGVTPSAVAADVAAAPGTAVSARRAIPMIILAVASVLIAWQFFVGASAGLRSEAKRAADALSPVERMVPAEDAVFEDATGAPVRLSDFKGKTIFLNFWATWCGPCIEEMPSLEAMARELAPEGLVVLAVSVDDTWGDVDRFFAGRETSLRILRDPGHAVADAWATRFPIETEPNRKTMKFPETFLIQPDFQIRHHFVGARVWSTDAALRYLRSML